MKKQLILVAVLSVMLSSCSTANRKLSQNIEQDTLLTVVDQKARSVIAKGFNAGSGYSQIWARDMNTFVETACEVSDPKQIREAILIFFAMQQPNGEMIDGYVLKPDFTWNDDTPYYSPYAPEHVGFKNTVETDQESSLIQIVSKYIRKTGDQSILHASVGGRTVMERMVAMVNYLMKERFDSTHGLLFGAMTADWGDVQPNDDFGCDMNDLSVKAIDIYDNAMFLIALDDLKEMSVGADAEKWQRMHDALAVNARKYLWDETHRKFIPHIYLGQSPLPKGFDENTIFYHGGTAVAIEAGLLSDEEIESVNNKMLQDVKESGMPTIGLTLYPTYPDGLFRGGMASPYVYQNGGDWTWFGGRMIQQLVAHGFAQEAYTEIRPMLERVVANDGFYEWYGMGNKPSGSGQFKGSAGVLAKAIEMLRDWAKENK